MEKHMEKTNFSKLPIGKAILMASAATLIFSTTACKRVTHTYDFTRGDTIQLEESTGITHIPASAFIRQGGVEAYSAEIYDDYERRATGPIHMAITAPTRMEAESWADRLGEALAHEGLRGEDYLVTILPYHNYDIETGVTVSYDAVSINLPNCPDTLHAATANTGCSIERQIGMMVARPADLRGVAGNTGYSGTDAALAVTRQQTREVDQRPQLLENVNTTE